MKWEYTVMVVPPEKTVVWELNRLGEEGWELVQVLEAKNDLPYRLVMKKQSE